METTFGSRLKRAWNVFTGNEWPQYRDIGPSSYYRPDRPRLTRGNEQSIINGICNRIAIDVSSISIQHVKLDDNGRYLEPAKSYLNYCLTEKANIDQTAAAFIQDTVMSMLDEGVVALVPTEATANPAYTDSYDIGSMRTAKILEWYPRHVKLRIYNDILGRQVEVIRPKTAVAIITNPLYSVMNEPNSTLQRLIRKLNLLDVIDEQSGSGKLDLIIQLPYVIKTEQRRQQAESRRKLIEDQLAGSKYGIAYTDGTERITQLNRAVDNNLMSQIEYLTSMLYSQLGITQGVMDGTADEKTMLNYDNRTIAPIISAIRDAIRCTFLSKTARTRGQSIEYFRDPFRLVPVSAMAEIADKFTRNEIMSSNEVRQVIGMKPANDPRADELRNKNLSKPSGEEPQAEAIDTTIQKEEEIQNG